MPSGLTIFESVFTSSSGGRGVIAGPHPSFSRFKESSNFTPVYHTIRPFKTPLLGFTADRSTSLKCFTQSKHDQSSQPIGIKDQREHPINSHVTIQSQTQTIKSTESLITNQSNYTDIAIKSEQIPHKIVLNEPSIQNDIKASIMPQISNFDESAQYSNDQIVKSSSSSLSTSKKITSNLNHVVSNISKAIKLTNSTISASQSGHQSSIVSQSTYQRFIYPKRTSQLSSLMQSTLEIFKFICFLTSAVRNQTSNEISKRDSRDLILIHPFDDPD